MQSIKLRASDAQRQRKQRDLLGMVAIANLVGLGIVGLFQVGIFGYMIALATKAPPSLVQMADGSSVVTSPLASKERTDVVIRRFTLDSMTLLMSWTGKVNTMRDGRTFPTSDAGVKVKTDAGKELRVPTSTWQASFALSEDFRPDFLQKVAEMLPPGVFQGTSQVVLVPREITNVQKLEDGKWKVTLVANLLTFSGSNQMGEGLTFNKEIYVRSVLPPVQMSQTSDLERLVGEIRQSGLEIYAITDATKPDLLR